MSSLGESVIHKKRQSTRFGKMLVVRKSRHVGVREQKEDRNDILRYNGVVYAQKKRCTWLIMQTGQTGED